jgi:O-antigen/teichoic acid export membrane protein
MTTLRRNSLYNLAGGIFRLGLSVVAVPLLIRVLGLERYGLWTVLLSIANVVFAIQPAWDAALTYFVSGAKARNAPEEMARYLGTSLQMAMVWGGIVALLLVVASPFLVHWAFGDVLEMRPLVVTLTLLALALWLRCLQQWALASEAALMRYDLSAKIESLSGIFQNLGLITLSLTGGGLPALAAWTAGVTMFFAGAHLVAVLRASSLSLKQLSFSASLVRPLTSYGLIQWISGLGSVMFAQGDRVLVNAYLGPSSAGLYAAVTALASKASEIVALPLQSLAPAVSAANALNDRQRIVRVYGRALRLNGIFVLALSCLLLFYTHPIAALLTTSSHAQSAGDLLLIIVPIYALYSLNGPGYYVALGLKKPFINACAVSLGGISTLVLMAWLMPRLNLWGAAIGNVGFQAVWIINLMVSHSLGLKSRWFFSQLGLVMVGFVFALAATVAIRLLLPGSVATGAVLSISAVVLGAALFHNELRDIYASTLLYLRQLLEQS